MSDTLELWTSDVNDRTQWRVVRIAHDGEVAGIGECSGSGPLPAVLATLSQLSSGLPRGGERAAIEDWAATAIAGLPRTRFARTVVGGVEQALCDASARTAGTPLWSWLAGKEAGGEETGGDGSVPVYANVNRVPGGRRPDEVAAAAMAAVKAGFTAVKCAPFDVADDRLPLAEAGMARLRAVRAAVGDDVGLLVDCHLKLGLDDVEKILPELERLRIGWLEDAADVEDVAGLKRLRQLTGLPLAGGEFTHEPDQLLPAIEAGLIDVIMPDVKHAGGVTRALALARAVDGSTVRVSPHNPSGPVATVVSAHLFRAAPHASVLEVAVGETAARAGTTRPAERVVNGRVFPAYGNGLALDLDFDSPPAARLAWSATL